MPRPRVQSAIVGLERTGPGPAPPVRVLVHAAFAQRRKTLVNALGAAGADKPAVAAALVAGALADRPGAGARPGGLPGARAGARVDGVTLTAPAKLNLRLLVGPAGADGYHPIRSLMVALAG